MTADIQTDSIVTVARWAHHQCIQSTSGSLVAMVQIRRDIHCVSKSDPIWNGI